MPSQMIKAKIKSAIPQPIFEALAVVKYRLQAEKVPDSDHYIKYVSGKNGIEIGGPSPLFRFPLPLYKTVKSLDGVNFSNSTLWEGQIEEGLTFNFFNKNLGRQFISDGTDLSNIGSASYDFVLSSNCLEHIANPLKALNEWKRILKDGGALILVLPNKQSNFDHKRPTTKFDHILEDYNNNISEHDLTHLDEILSLHDLSMDPPAGDIHNFKKRSLENFHNRSLHHHVYDLDVMTKMAEFLGFNCVHNNETFKDIFLLAVKKPASAG